MNKAWGDIPLAPHGSLDFRLGHFFRISLLSIRVFGRRGNHPVTLHIEIRFGVEGLVDAKKSIEAEFDRAILHFEVCAILAIVFDT